MPGLKPNGHVSRRLYYSFPARGEPGWLVHQVEPYVLDPSASAKIAHARWQEQEAGLRKLLQDARNVAMQYAPLCAVPYVSNVDAGIIELIRSLGVDDAVSGHITSHGVAQYIRHRTGHCIGREVRGVRANMNNMAAHDERPVMPWRCFLVQPALYLPTFWVGTEVNAFIEKGHARVTGEMQTEFVWLC